MQIRAELARLSPGALATVRMALIPIIVREHLDDADRINHGRVPDDAGVVEAQLTYLLTRMPEHQVIAVLKDALTTPAESPLKTMTSVASGFADTIGPSFRRRRAEAAPRKRRVELSVEARRALWREFHSHGVARTALAKKYNVSLATVSNIVRRKKPR